MAKPKVLFLARLYLPHVGGVEKHLQKISALLKSRYDITIVCFKHDPKLVDFEIIDGISVYRLPKLDKWSVWSYFLIHNSLFRTADIVHIHDVFYWYLPFVYLNKKVFMTFHGYEGADPPKCIQIFWHRLAAFFTRGNLCIGGFHQKYYGVSPTFISYGAT